MDILNQEFADKLLKMDKVPEDENAIYEYPDLGGRLSVPLISTNGRENFLLDINVKRISLKATYQTRGRQTLVLARLDFNSPHRNPDGTEVGVPHLHVYKEGYGDKWAIEIPEGLLSNPDSAWQNLIDFMKYCHIIEEPKINHGLFSCD